MRLAKDNDVVEASRRMDPIIYQSFGETVLPG
jgi:hypothetical protein